MKVREIQLDQLVGQELKRQMERQNAKEELLNLDTSQVYDKKMNKQLEAALNYAYPYADDTKLYTQMSVSELKKAEPDRTRRGRHGNLAGKHVENGKRS